MLFIFFTHMNITYELSLIKNCTSDIEKKTILSNIFEFLKSVETNQLPEKPLFFDFIKLYLDYFEDASCLRPVVKKYNFSNIEIQNSIILNKVIKAKRVSWDTNLVEVREIESCKKRIKKNVKIDIVKKHNPCIYDYDVQKICECDSLLVKNLLFDISQYFDKM